MKKLLTILPILLLLSGSCSSSEDISSQIVGNWKLVASTQYGFNGEVSTDYSKENILYNFKQNGTLQVSGGENVGYPDGAYEYFFGEDYLGGENDPKVLLVKINDSKWTYNQNSGKMTLGKSYVDGPNLIFERK